MHAQNQRTGELLLDLVKLDRGKTGLTLTDTIAN